MLQTKSPYLLLFTFLSIISLVGINIYAFSLYNSCTKKQCEVCETCEVCEESQVINELQTQLDWYKEQYEIYKQKFDQCDSKECIKEESSNECPPQLDLNNIHCQYKTDPSQHFNIVIDPNLYDCDNNVEDIETTNKSTILIKLKESYLDIMNNSNIYKLNNKDEDIINSMKQTLQVVISGSIKAPAIPQGIGIFDFFQTNNSSMYPIIIANNTIGLPTMEDVIGVGLYKNNISSSNGAQILIQKNEFNSDEYISIDISSNKFNSGFIDISDNELINQKQCIYTYYSDVEIPGIRNYDNTVTLQNDTQCQIEECPVCNTSNNNQLHCKSNTEDQHFTFIADLSTYTCDNNVENVENSTLIKLQTQTDNQNQLLINGFNKTSPYGIDIVNLNFQYDDHQDNNFTFNISNNIIYNNENYLYYAFNIITNQITSRNVMWIFDNTYQTVQQGIKINNNHIANGGGIFINDNVFKSEDPVPYYIHINENQFKTLDTCYYGNYSTTPGMYIHDNPAENVELTSCIDFNKYNFVCKNNYKDQYFDINIDPYVYTCGKYEVHNIIQEYQLPTVQIKLKQSIDLDRFDQIYLYGSFSNNSTPFVKQIHIENLTINQISIEDNIFEQTRDNISTNSLIRIYYNDFIGNGEYNNSNKYNSVKLYENNFYGNTHGSDVYLNDNTFNNNVVLDNNIFNMQNQTNNWLYAVANNITNTSVCDIYDTNRCS